MSRSSRVESIWPSLIKVGPSSSSASPHPLLRLEMRDVAGFSPVQYLSGALEQRGDSCATHEVAEPMPNRTELISRKRGSSRAVLNDPETMGGYLPSFASVWSRSASATPANTPLASKAIRTLAPRIVASPEPASMLRANSPIMLATRTLASTPRFWA